MSRPPLPMMPPPPMMQPLPAGAPPTGSAHDDSIAAVSEMTRWAVPTIKYNLGLLKLLDLSRIQEKVHATNDGVEDYKKFLAIRATIAMTTAYDTNMLSPTDNMDALWHAHILDTRAYKDCCEALMGPGGFMHHDPHADKDLAVRAARRAVFKSFWNQAFDEPPKEGWGLDPSACCDYVKRMKKRKRRRVSDDAFQIYVKTLTGRSIAMDVDDDTEVEDVKLALHDKGEAPPEQQRLIFAGKQLDDGRTMRDCKVIKGSTLHLVLRLSGC